MGDQIIFPLQKLTLLEFWGTWCKPCIEELPFLQDVNEFFSSANFEIVGIANDSKENVSKFIKNNPISWSQIPTSYRSEDNILQTYKVRSFPSLFLIDGDGMILEETSSLRYYSLYQGISKHLNQDPQLFIDYILEGDVILSLPKNDFVTVLIREGALSERSKFLYEHNGSFVRGFSWPDNAEEVSVTMVIEYHDFKKEIKQVTVTQKQIINGVIVIAPANF